jgi:hypothetical protein
LPVSKLEAAGDEMVLQDDHFVPLAVLQTAIHFWWLVSLLATAGGWFGWLAHRTLPPVYEAVAHFSTSIDYVSTGPLTQFEEDTAINVVGNVIYSNNVAQRVIDQAAAEGIPIRMAELKKAAVLERRVNVWDLRVRNTDPQVAVRLANLWAEQGQTALVESYQHALQADRLNRYLQSLESCLAKAAASEPANGQCSSARFSEIEKDMQTAGKAFYQERIASRGLFSGLTIGPVDQAAAADGPVLYGRNQMVLAGCFIGFLLGILLVQTGIPARLPAWRHAVRPGRS